jgi:EAL and modified HD-GYP domain-containing signal transduction protein
MNTLLSRQPIFDATDHLAAYELFYPEESLEHGGGNGNGDGSDRVVVDAVLGVGLGRIAEGRPAYLRTSRDMLMRRTVDLIDPRSVVLQIPGDTRPDAELLGMCKRLIDTGYRFALDHFTMSEGAAPLLGIADIVKVDVRAYPGDQLARAAKRMKAYRVRLLAENVENRTVRDACIRLGFDFFQGYHYSRPETVTRRDLSVEHLRTLRLMSLVRDLAVSDHAVEEAFRADVALTYKLLRMVNASATGCADITSVSHAIGLLGRETLYRWLALLLITPGGRAGVDIEIANATLTRARFCEVLADAGDRPLRAPTLFLTGLLSGLDAYYQMPVSDMVEHLGLAKEVSAALVEHAGPIGSVLMLIEAYEKGDWTATNQIAADLGIADRELSMAYLEALAWANERVQLFRSDT